MHLALIAKQLHIFRSTLTYVFALLAAVAVSSVVAGGSRVQAVDVCGRMLHLLIHPAHDRTGGGAIPGRMLPSPRTLARDEEACPRADRRAVGRGHAQCGTCVGFGRGGAIRGRSQ